MWVGRGDGKIRGEILPCNYMNVHSQSRLHPPAGMSRGDAGPHSRETHVLKRSVYVRSFTVFKMADTGTCLAECPCFRGYHIVYRGYSKLRTRTGPRKVICS